MPTVTESRRPGLRLTRKTGNASVTEVRIVEAAAQLFARRGFKATTTREIAQLADLNEATLFRYFSRKPEIFWAAVESHVARVKIGRDTQSSLASDQEPAVVVPRLIAFLLESLANQPNLQRLLHVAAFELPESDKMIREHLGPIYDMVCAYFKRCVEKGSIRKIEPSLVTLGLLGTVSVHRGLCFLLTGFDFPYRTTDEAVEAHATLWLNGLLPSTIRQISGRREGSIGSA